MNTEIVFNKKDTIDGFATERVDALHNSLLGNYSHDGEYVISGKILRELLSVKKYVAYTFKNSVFCTAFLRNNRQINFEIVFKKENKKLVSELYLLENVSKVNGYFSNTVKTIVSVYIDEENKNFTETTNRFFNVLKKLNTDDGEDDGEMVIDESYFVENAEVYNITSKMDLSSLMLNELKSSHEKNFESIFKTKLDALKKDKNPFGEIVLKEFNSEYSKIERHFFVDEKGKVRFKALNELLDKSIETMSGTDKSLSSAEKDFRESIERENKIFANNTLENEAKAIEIVGGKASKKGQENILDAIKGNREIKQKFISMESSGGEKPYPIIKDQPTKQSESQTSKDKGKVNINEYRNKMAYDFSPTPEIYAREKLSNQNIEAERGGKEVLQGFFSTVQDVANSSEEPIATETQEEKVEMEGFFEEFGFEAVTLEIIEEATAKKEKPDKKPAAKEVDLDLVGFQDFDNEKELNK